MSPVDVLIGNLRSHGIQYIVCIAALVFAAKYLGDHRKPRKFVILGVSLILGALLGGAILHILFHAMIVGSQPDPRDPNSFKRHMDALGTLASINSILAFVMGLMHSAGLASVLYAVFVDKIQFAAKSSRKRRRREEDDEDDDDDRPRKRRAVRDEDDEEEEPRPRRRRPREDD